jgi:hypothetical protein
MHTSDPHSRDSHVKASVAYRRGNGGGEVSLSSVDLRGSACLRIAVVSYT